MKKMTKLLTFVSILPMLIACDGGVKNPEYGNQDSYKIGILLPVEHDALNAAANGFQDAIKNSALKDKVEFVIKNANGSSDDQRTMAKQLIAECDMALGLGTGASKDLVDAQKNRGSKKAILFSAVTDPVDAKLVDSLEAPGGWVTGTSDAQPVADQISLIKDCLPEAKKVGVFYTITESNSDVQARQAKAAIEAAGMTYVPQTCTAANDIQSSITSLVTTGVDAIYIPTDNNVAANMNYVANAVRGKGILVLTGEEGMLNNGGQLTLSISYSNLGARTGEMAVSILNGEKTPSEISVLTMKKEDCVYVMNSSMLSDAGVTLPDAVKNKCTDVAAK